MAKVETYSSLEEKEEFFEQNFINTKEDLDQIILQYKNEQKKGKLVFRGCTEAKYKLFNSAQREWISKELHFLGFSYLQFIRKEILNARKWQNNLLDKFFSAFDQPTNDLIILGFLQHYSAPTPLLDWTYSFENSLFFATDDLKYAQFENENEINNYFSIYIIDTKWNELINLLDYVKLNLRKIDRIASENPNVYVRNELDIIQKLEYQSLYDMKLILIPGYQKNGTNFKIRNNSSFSFFYNQQNLNIINQKGLFIFNASEDKPLEHFFPGAKFFDGGYTFQLPLIKCINIHKSLFEYIQKYLNERKPIPINKNFIFPQEELIAKNSFQQMLNFEYWKNE